MTERAAAAAAAASAGLLCPRPRLNDDEASDRRQCRRQELRVHRLLRLRHRRRPPIPLRTLSPVAFLVLSRLLRLEALDGQSRR